MGKKIFKIGLIVILLVALVYLIVSTFLMNDSSTNTKFGGYGKMVGSSSTSNASTDKMEVTIDKILINMKSGSYKYMKADMAFKMSNSNSKSNIQENMPSVRDTILRFSSNQDSNRLATPEGKQQYKKELKGLLLESYGMEIDDIYFSNFVLAK